MNNRDWMQRDLRHVWHPCTQMQDHETLPVVPIQRGEGVWLHDFEGRRYLDAVSSWWVNLFGHANPRINAAIKAQLDTLEHVILAGFTHEPIIELSERLVQKAPPGLTRCFYGDNGSAATEIALKMSLHFWRNTGQPGKTRFICLEGGYHGETLGSLAVTDIPLFSATYAPLLKEHLRAPSPEASRRESGETAEAWARRQFMHMEALLERHHHEVCAVILEPLVQGAAGMKMYHPVYLTLLREACDRYGVHLIADEIAVGFGRTGTLFCVAAHRARQRRRLARLHPAVQGHHRRHPAALAGAHHRRRLPGLLVRGHHARFPAFAFLHRQPGGLRGGPGRAGPLRRRPGSAERAAGAVAGRCLCPAGPGRPGAPPAPARHHPGL